MLRIIQRGITRTALPHPWFDLEHPMLKPDPQLMKLIRYRQSIGKLVQKEDRDMSLEECNADPQDVYEMTSEAYFSDPPVMEMLQKLYANFSPGKIIQQVSELPGFDFDKRLQVLEKFDSNYTNQEMSDAKVIDGRYVVSRFCPPKFKRLIDVVLEKLPIFGSVVERGESERFFELSAAIDKEIQTFFFGGGAFFSDFERSMFRRYIFRQMAYEEFLDNREIPFVTEAEDNFTIGMINWPGSDDHEYRCFYRPYFREFIVEKEFWGFPQHTMVHRIYRRMWYYNYYKYSLFSNPKHFAATVGITIVDRLKRYFISREFNYGKN
jgi:hypothetical protein